MVNCFVNGFNNLIICVVFINGVFVMCRVLVDVVIIDVLIINMSIMENVVLLCWLV